MDLIKQSQKLSEANRKMSKLLSSRSQNDEQRPKKEEDGVDNVGTDDEKPAKTEKQIKAQENKKDETEAKNSEACNDKEDADKQKMEEEKRARKEQKKAERLRLQQELEEQLRKEEEWEQAFKAEQAKKQLEEEQKKLESTSLQPKPTNSDTRQKPSMPQPRKLNSTTNAGQSRPQPLIVEKNMEIKAESLDDDQDQRVEIIKQSAVTQQSSAITPGKPKTLIQPRVEFVKQGQQIISRKEEPENVKMNLEAKNTTATNTSKTQTESKTRDQIKKQEDDWNLGNDTSNRPSPGGLLKGRLPFKQPLAKTNEPDSDDEDWDA